MMSIPGLRLRKYMRALGGAWIFGGASVGCAVLALRGFWRATWSLDVAMYSVIGDHILDGARPYVDLIDINPPLILYIHTFFSYLARLTGADSLQLFQGAVLAGAAISSTAIFLILREERWGGGGGGCAAISLSTSVFALFTFVFGQREHLFMLAFLPYISLRWKQKRGTWAVLTTLLTATLACLKPGFFVLVVTFEVLLYGQRKKREPLHWALLVLPLLIYLLHFLFWSTEALRAFWLDLVPTVLRFYRNMDLPPGKMVEFWWGAIVTYSVLSVLYIRQGLRENRFLSGVGVLALIALGSALIQHKVWEYHLLPAQFLVAYGFPIFIYNCREINPRTRHGLALGVTSLVFLLGYATYSLRHFSITAEFSERAFNYPEMRKLTKPGDSVIFFTWHPSFMYPLARERRLRLGCRYAFLFPIVFFRPRLILKKDGVYEGPMPEEEKRFITAMRSDIDNRKPDLIVFPHNMSGPWRWLTRPFYGLSYARQVGIFDVDDPRYAMVWDSEEMTVFRRK